MRRLNYAAVALLSCAMPLAAHAQDEEAPGVAGGRMVRGTVTDAAADHLSLKTERGDTYQVALTANTRVMKDRQPMKPAEIKPGDGIGAMGVIDAPNHTIHAAVVMIVDAAQIQKMRDEMGKSYIAGRVTAIDLDNLKLTIQRADNVSQVIAVDEGTSFRKGGRRGNGEMEGEAPSAAPRGDSGGESITLADIKVGDMVGGRGSLKNGIFVPAELRVGNGPGLGPRAGYPGRRRQNGTDAGAAPSAPGAPPQ
ncbi:MAG TPA: hypothetical protein VGC07_00530 [Granulicella sp.]